MARGFSARMFLSYLRSNTSSDVLRNVYDSSREKIAKGHDPHIAGSGGIRPLSYDAGVHPRHNAWTYSGTDISSAEAVGGNTVKKSSLPHELHALVMSTSSRGIGELDTSPACPNQPPASINTRSPQSEPTSLPPPTAASASLHLTLIMRLLRPCPPYPTPIVGVFKQPRPHPQTSRWPWRKALGIGLSPVSPDNSCATQVRNLYHNALT